ncbi:hypothetical protein [Nonomuraea lactucae]|uniref:hypothetical protein n=1 Tax=Nonomuraea lactucae TaxID=2249762 RepID=UPI000DE57024|nr:hypothetical protein [Nonomuraea lactucae]
MSIRYFEIRAPRADFTGRVGAVSFADGVARVSFDDTRTDGMCMADEHAVQVGRSALLFAQRRPGYTVIETDAAGQPLPEPEEKPKRRTSGKPPAPPKGPAAPPASPTDPSDPKKEGEQ